MLGLGRRGRRRRRLLPALWPWAAVALGAWAALTLLPAPGWWDPGRTQLTGSARATDGDTLRIGGERVRLLGIDAPELDQTCSGADGSTWACGAAAHRMLDALLARGSIVCEGTGRDRYGRVLAHCAIDGADLGEAMVREGLALGDEAYLLTELGARTRGAGMWAGDFESPRTWRDRRGGQEKEPGLLDWLLSRLGG